MTVTFHARYESGLTDPTSTSGVNRPLLRLNLPWHTVHYTGIEVKSIFFSGGDGVFDTIDQVFAFMRRLEEVARASGKPFEYNTVIPVMSDGSSHVVAYADEFVAAHSAGENADSHGTLFATGINQPLNQGAIDAFRWWHAVLLSTGRLSADSKTVPHKAMPGAATACPGDRIMNVWDQLVIPWVAPSEPERPVDPEPINPPQQENVMATEVLIIKDSREPYAVWKSDGIVKTWVNTGDVAAQIEMRLAECEGGTKPSPVDGFVYRELRHGSNDVIASYGPVLGPHPGSRFDNYGRLVS